MPHRAPHSRARFPTLAALRNVYNAFVDLNFGEMLDTSPAQRRRYYDLVRALTSEERARKVSSLSRAARGLAEVNILTRHPGASPGQLARLLAERLYGAEIAARLFRE